jgi:hypothetical protein
MAEPHRSAVAATIGSDIRPVLVERQRVGGVGVGLRNPVFMKACSVQNSPVSRSNG